jgi:hypothetical protein
MATNREYFDAATEGKQAFRNNVPLNNNPYPEGTSEYNAWRTWWKFESKRTNP